MAAKKAKKETKPAQKTSKKPQTAERKPGKSPQQDKSKKSQGSYEDMGIVIVDEDLEYDKDKENEERRAYLEEARSQEAFD